MVVNDHTYIIVYENPTMCYCRHWIKSVVVRTTACTSCLIKLRIFKDKMLERIWVVSHLPITACSCPRHHGFYVTYGNWRARRKNCLLVFCSGVREDWLRLDVSIRIEDNRAYQVAEIQSECFFIDSLRATTGSTPKSRLSSRISIKDSSLLVLKAPSYSLKARKLNSVSDCTCFKIIINVNNCHIKVNYQCGFN